MVNKSSEKAQHLLGRKASCRVPAGTISEPIVLRPPDSLTINPHNARSHSKRQIRQIANSIKAAGFIGAIVIDEADIVLRGHGTLAASKILKLERVPTLKVTGLSEAQKRAFVIADNKIAENAGWNREILATELRDLAELLPPLNLGLELTGFSTAEVDALFANHAVSKADPAGSLPPHECGAGTWRGDMWCLGPHRLLCGDACSPTDLDRLMGNERARMVFFDAPFCPRARDVQGPGSINQEQFEVASREMTEQEYVAFLREGLGNAARVSVDGALHYVCEDWWHIAELITAGRAIYGAMHDLCVWVKSNTGLGSHCRAQHELIAVFRVGNAEHKDRAELGGSKRNRSNVWTYPGVNSSISGHMQLSDMAPIAKPVALIADAMRDCTHEGDVVLDSFAGAGSTVIAAEKIGRRCRGLEWEPRSVDVAIRRWEAYTRMQAVLDGDGRTYAEIKIDRESSPAEFRQPPSAPADDKQHNLHPTVPASNEAEDWVRLCEPVAVTPTEGADQ
jgi:hypothetical protein